MTRPPGRAAEQAQRDLIALHQLAGKVADADQAARVLRDHRDVIVLDLARAGCPHKLIAAAAQMTQQSVSKIARAAGVYRQPQRPRKPAPGP